MNTLIKSVYNWIDQRLGLEELQAFAGKKRVPKHSQSFWYYWGGISLFFFLIQAITGVLLMVYYRPGPDAYESVRQINADINFGWFFRSLHSWSANLMVAAVFVHMFSVYFMKAYRSPREFGWWTGLALLGIVMVFGFSGYLLPMDELAFFATKVGLEIPGKIPVIGQVLANLARGGAEVGPHTVQRFFALHVVVLPALFIPMLMAHLWLVQKHGNAVPPSEEEKPLAQRRSIPFFPNFVMKDIAVWLVAINVLSVLAAIYPWELGPQADALKPAPKGIHPEWYFMSQFQVLKVLGDWFQGEKGEIIGVLLFTACLATWFLIPLFDPSKASGKRGRQATYIGLIALASLIITTIWGYWAT